jgi:hypothetical protein
MDSAGHASIPTLNADTLDLPPQENQEEPKDYRGEYYPVAHPKAAEGRHA